MQTEKVKQRLFEHLEAARLHYNIADTQWLFIAACGSMNYNLDGPQSDIDSKLVILPTLDDLIDNKKLHHLHIMDDNQEHCEVKDLKNYLSILMKQNINFLEVFFTDYVIVNPMYQAEMQQLTEQVHKLVFLDPVRTLHSVKGMLHTKHHQIFESSPGRSANIEKYGYDGKSLCHLLRLKYFTLDFIDRVSGDDYKKLIWYDDGSMAYNLLMYAKNHQFSAIDVQYLANYVLQTMDNTIDGFINAISKDGFSFNWYLFDKPVTLKDIRLYHKNLCQQMQDNATELIKRSILQKEVL